MIRFRFYSDTNQQTFEDVCHGRGIPFEHDWPHTLADESARQLALDLGGEEVSDDNATPRNQKA